MPNAGQMRGVGGASFGTCASASPSAACVPKDGPDLSQAQLDAILTLAPAGAPRALRALPATLAESKAFIPTRGHNLKEVTSEHNI